MKYLNLFENWQEDMKNKQSIHILDELSCVLESILISIKNSTDSKNTNVKRNIFDNNIIDITYFVHKRVKLLKIALDTKEDFFYIRIKLYDQSYVYNIRELRKGCDSFLKFLNDKLKKYSIVNKNSMGENIVKICVFGIPLSEKNNIIDILNEFSTYLDAEKYNL